MCLSLYRSLGNLLIQRATLQSKGWRILSQVSSMILAPFLSSLCILAFFMWLARLMLVDVAKSQPLKVHKKGFAVP